MKARRPRARRVAAGLLGAGLLLAGAGALALDDGGAQPGPAPDAAGDAGPPPADDGPDAPGAPAQPVVKVEVDAPGALKDLLERYLDVARLARLTRGDAVTGTELQRLIDVAPLQVRELLQTEGYFNPQLRVQRLPPEPGPTPQPETVRLHVTPGPRAVIGSVTIEAEGPLDEADAAGDAAARAVLADLRGRWTLPAGTVFRNTAWADAKTAALTRLRGAGYAAATWAGSGAEVDRETHRVRVFLVADSGPLFRSGAIRVEGLVRQDAETVRTMAGFAPGTPITEALLLDYQNRLQKAGLFESATVTLDPDPAHADAAAVIVQLREQPLQVWTVGVGVSANNGPRGSLEHAYRRVFGYAVSSLNQFELGRVRQAWTGEISTHPGALSRRWLIGGTVERLVSSTDVVLSQRLRAGRAQETSTREQLIYAEAERGRRTTDTSDVSVIAVSGNYHVVLRHLDSVLLPTEGYTLALEGGLGRSHGSDSRAGPFARAYGRLTYYRPLGPSWYGQARVEVGQVFLPHGVVAPDSQLWRAGGDASVRGYAYRSLAPTVDGAVVSAPVLATGSLELARPFTASMPSLWGAVFIDAGRAGYDFATLNPALGYGVGVRWRSPVGPLRLDLAWGEEVHALRLHFSVGIAF
jgi:translocation and assembly module TamA